MTNKDICECGIKNTTRIKIYENQSKRLIISFCLVCDRLMSYRSQKKNQNK